MCFIHDIIRSSIRLLHSTITDKGETYLDKQSIVIRLLTELTLTLTNEILYVVSLLQITLDILQLPIE